MTYQTCPRCSDSSYVRTNHGDIRCPMCNQPSAAIADAPDNGLRWLYAALISGLIFASVATHAWISAGAP